MGLYIKGVKMPKECAQCPSGLSICVGCDAFFKGDRPSGRIRDDCPLVEVAEPHGRLIDADKIGVWWTNDARIAIEHAPTVIEAEASYADTTD